MDFQLTGDQTDIKDGIRKLCEGRFPISWVRTLEGPGFDADMWASLTETGVFALRESGFGVTEAALVFEELGRGLIPGPTIWTHLAAGMGIDAPVVGGLTRTGGPVVVEHLDVLDALLVVDDDGVWRVEPRSLAGTPGVALDPMTPVTVLDALPKGEQVGGADEARALNREGAVLAAAQLAGIAAALVDLTVAYTKDRHQFGRPVGSFQALKHVMADMLTRAEMARVQVYAAAVHLDDPTLALQDRSVSSAKVIAGHAALENGAASIQCHGGMGYTWEVDSHLYLKRAWVLDGAFGSADEHALAVAERVHEE